jgi:hypothetical protein
MARPQVEDGGDALQIRRVVANILNKQSRIADNGSFCSFEVGRGHTNSSPLKINLLRNVTKGLGLGRTLSVWLQGAEESISTEEG